MEPNVVCEPCVVDGDWPVPEVPPFCAWASGAARVAKAKMPPMMKVPRRFMFLLLIERYACAADMEGATDPKEVQLICRPIYGMNGCPAPAIPVCDLRSWLAPWLRAP